jgi:hypothetical protein
VGGVRREPPHSIFIKIKMEKEENIPHIQKKYIS